MPNGRMLWTLDDARNNLMVVVRWGHCRKDGHNVRERARTCDNHVRRVVPLFMLLSWPGSLPAMCPPFVLEVAESSFLPLPEISPRTTS